MHHALLDAGQEKAELANEPEAEHRELVGIYVARGLARPLAQQIATNLMAHDALGAHARDELGISDITQARPLQTALASALSFAIGTSMPLLITAITRPSQLVPVLVAATLVGLAALGALAARSGDAPMLPAALRVTCWSALAMAATVAVRSAFDAAA